MYLRVIRPPSPFSGLSQFHGAAFSVSFWGTRERPPPADPSPSRRQRGRCRPCPSCAFPTPALRDASHTARAPALGRATLSASRCAQSSPECLQEKHRGPVLPLRPEIRRAISSPEYTFLDIKRKRNTGRVPKGPGAAQGEAGVRP